MVENVIDLSGLAPKGVTGTISVVTRVQIEPIRILQNIVVELTYENGLLINISLPKPGERYVLPEALE